MPSQNGGTMKWTRRLLFTAVCVAAATATFGGFLSYRQHQRTLLAAEHTRFELNQKLMDQRLETKDRETRQAQVAQFEAVRLQQQAEMAQHQAEAEKRGTGTASP